MNGKDVTLALFIAIALGLCLTPSAMASTEEQQANQTKDAAQLKMEALEAELGEEGMKKEEYKAGLQDIWDRYPENITKDDYAFMIELGPMVEKESLKKYQDQNYSNNIDPGSDNSRSGENEPSKSNSAPCFGLLGSLTCLYGGWKLRKK